VSRTVVVLCWTASSAGVVAWSAEFRAGAVVRWTVSPAGAGAWSAVFRAGAVVRWTVSPAGAGASGRSAPLPAGVACSAVPRTGVVA
jgi:hypothetical protein